MAGHKQRVGSVKKKSVQQQYATPQVQHESNLYQESSHVSYRYAVNVDGVKRKEGRTDSWWKAAGEVTRFWQACEDALQTIVVIQQEGEQHGKGKRART